MNIRLIRMTVDETANMNSNLSGPNYCQYIFAPDAIPPHVVLDSGLERHRAGERWFWCAPRLFILSVENLVIGSGCFKNSPLEGAVEIGCGVAENYRDKNYATEGVRLLVEEGFSKHEVKAITAETAVWNTASQRVLVKASFTRTGERVDPEDGPVIIWRLDRTAR